MSDPAWHDPRQLLAAVQRLRGKRLMQPSDTLSLRLPGTDAFLIASESMQSDGRAITIPLAGAGAGMDAELHKLAYLARADVGAVLLSRQCWAAALPAAGGTLPGVFDEQLRHLGAAVTQIAAPQTPAEARTRLAGGANAFGMGAQVLCLGMTLERLVFNTELLEKCAQAYLLARASSLPVRRIPWLVRRIATARLHRDQRLAAASYARGEAPQRVAGY